VDFAPDTPVTAGSAARADDALLLHACHPVMAPLARLAVARGMQYAQFDELMRAAFVQAAREAHPDVPSHRAVSRVSAATGINRREVTRLLKAESPEAPPRRAPATEIFARWITDPTLRHQGAPLKSLPRQGAAPSFESLAQSVTKDVHPRSLLEELCRLGLARVDDETDSVVLLRETYVPSGDDKRLFGFLGANVGGVQRARRIASPSRAGAVRRRALQRIARAPATHRQRAVAVAGARHRASGAAVHRGRRGRRADAGPAAADRHVFVRRADRTAGRRACR
jgi:hypothetical protein